MKKSLIASAIYWAIVGVANAEPPQLQLYGAIDLGLTHYTGVQSTNNAGQTVSVTGLSSGVNAASGFGLRGGEDLGSDLRVSFDLATGFCAAGTNQAGEPPLLPSQAFCAADGFMQRRAYIGLGGGFGEFRVGKQVTALANQEGAVDPFGDGLTGGVGNISLLGNNIANMGLSRLNQSVLYTTPTYSGLTASAHYSFNAGSATAPLQAGAGKPTAIVLDFNHASGPSLVGLSWARYPNYALSVAPGGASASAPALSTYKLWMLYGSYDFGPVKLGSMWQHSTDAAYSGTQNVALLGATLPTGPGSVMMSVAEHSTSMAARPLTLGTSHAWQYALGYMQPLSKRLTAYTSYALIRNSGSGPNRSGTSFTVASATGSFNGVVGKPSSGATVGLTYQF
jgi:predicted porin